MEILYNIFEPMVASDGTASWATKSSTILDAEQTNETIPVSAETQAQKCMNAVKKLAQCGFNGLFS